ncbi:efflux RND transporter periplasmic adaptor subunit [Ferrigenium sp. UT5]|uniref:efflux RND transporter periplasmic adaptor subunit n=1 Tax=Ferrigenium sp. UT5 TaxID=3242105 RepID=UPI00354E2CDC
MKSRLNLLAVLLLLSACGGKEQTAAPAAPAGGMPPPPEVEVITVMPGKATYTQDLPGRVQAYRTAQVRARVDGVIEQRLFREGSDVKAGSSLFRIDARSFMAALAAARADALAANHTEQRFRRLLEKNMVSQQEYDLAFSRAQQAEAARIRAEEDVQYAHVPAPISGHVGRAEVTEGALVSKSAATLLTTLEQLDRVYVNFTQPGADVLRLRRALGAGALRQAESTELELVLEDGGIYPQRGKIFFSDMAVDTSTGAVGLRAVFPNPKRELLPGMFVRARFPQATADNVLRVPQRAVQAGPHGQFVMVVAADGTALAQPIVTGGMAGADFIVSSGLKGGEQVIVGGLQKARPGARVVAKPAGSTPPPEGERKPGN